MTELFDSVDKYLPTVPIDTDLTFYSKIDNQLDQPLNFWGNVNNYLYSQNSFVKPVTYTATGASKTLFQGSHSVFGADWDGTNFTTSCGNRRRFYNANNSFNNQDLYTNGETQGQSNSITASSDYVLGKSTLTIGTYGIRSLSPPSGFLDMSGITTTPTGLIAFPFSGTLGGFFISSDGDNKVYETNSTATTVIDEWNVDTTSCQGVAFIDFGNPTLNELWVVDNTGTDVIGYNYATKEEIGRFTIPLLSTVKDIVNVSGNLWIVYNNGFIAEYARD